MKSFFLFFALNLLLLPGCTNWKAKFYQSRVELERCINRDFDKEVTGGDVIIEFPGKVIELPPLTPPPADTITVIDTVDHVVTRTVYRDVAVDPSPALHFEKDSVSIWLTIYNRIEKASLLQSIKIDSLKYPAKVKHHYRTIIKQQINWTQLFIAAGIGLFFGAAGFLIISIRIK